MILVEKAKSHIIVGSRLIIGRIFLLLLFLLLSSSGGRGSIAGSGSRSSGDGAPSWYGTKTSAAGFDNFGEVLATERAHDLLESVIVNFDAHGSEDLLDVTAGWLRSSEGSEQVSCHVTHFDKY